jgi:hypothetical protein
LPLEYEELLAQQQVLGNQRPARSGDIDNQADNRRGRSSGLSNASYGAPNAASDDAHELFRDALQHGPVMHRMLDRHKLANTRKLSDSAADPMSSQ